MQYNLYKLFTRIDGEVYFIHFKDNEKNNINFYFSKNPEPSKEQNSPIFHHPCNKLPDDMFKGIKISEMKFETACFTCKIS